MWIRQILLLMLIGSMLGSCGQPFTAQHAERSNVVAPSEQAENTTHSEASYITMRSLKERIAKEPIVVIGQVTGTGEVINMARNVYDINQPDPTLFGVGQVYHFQVQQYLKGSGPSTLNIVQPEGMISADPATVTADDIRRAKTDSVYAYTAFQTGTTYLFLLHRLDGFDPANNYFTGGIHPWIFVVSSDGSVTMDAPGEVVAQLPPDFIPNRDAPLLPQIKQIIQEQQAGKP